MNARQAIIGAGSALAAQGRTPTVTEAAEAAGVSRATAYRYFPNQDSLVRELRLPLDEFEAELAATEGLPLPERARAVVEIIARGSFRYQESLRDVLRASLGAAGPSPEESHGALRRQVVASVLRPLRAELNMATYERLAALLELLMGIESVIVMNAIAGLDQDDAVAALGWAAQALVATQIAEQGS